MRAQRRNPTRVFLIKDDSPPALASSTFLLSHNALVWSILGESAPQEMSSADIQLATSQHMYYLPKYIHASSCCLLTYFQIKELPFFPAFERNSPSCFVFLSLILIQTFLALSELN